MPHLKDIPGETLAYLATTTAIAISQDFDLDDLAILSSFFGAIGSNLSIIAAQRGAQKGIIIDP
ncbi:hypothetical protein [Clostridium minihomine]|uniref:hypothetical protein n=1 Tax=Clostridium minihomine TaxID=2045012 RepID=UPI000C780D93|nr:hypothetical protein [Clostridium minihomine]